MSNAIEILNSLDAASSMIRDLSDEAFPISGWPPQAALRIEDFIEVCDEADNQENEMMKAIILAMVGPGMLAWAESQIEEWKVAVEEEDASRAEWDASMESLAAGRI